MPENSLRDKQTFFFGYHWFLGLHRMSPMIEIHWALHVPKTVTHSYGCPRTTFPSSRQLPLLMSYTRQEYSAVKLENGTVTTEHWNAYPHNQDTPLRTRPRGHAPRTRPQLLHVEPSILHTFNLKLLKTKAMHSPPPSRFQIHLGWLQELREAKKHFSFFKSSFQKASKVKFSSRQSKNNGILTSQAGLIHLSIRKRCFFYSDAVVCLVKYHVCSILKSDPCPDTGCQLQGRNHLYVWGCRRAFFP